LTFGGRSLLFQQNVIPSSKGAELGAKDINHPVRLSYKPYFFQPSNIVFSHNKSANSTFSHGFLAKRTRVSLLQFD
jgi:hypothetical protein